MLSPLTRPGSRIAQAVSVNGSASLYFTSGMLADPANPEAPTSDPAHMGPMSAQARSALQKLDGNLRAQGLTFRDVYFLRAMLAPDLREGGAVDFAAWNAAYDDFFNNAENPHRPARTTMAAPDSNNSNRIIEIEAYAAYPDAGAPLVTPQAPGRTQTSWPMATLRAFSLTACPLPGTPA